MPKPKLKDFSTQEQNANKHSARGLAMLSDSIDENGWAGAITVTENNEAIDGSARLQTAYTKFGKDVEPIIVQSDGTRPIIVQRTDIPNADHPKAKALGLAANRVAQVNLTWDTEVLLDLVGEGIDVSSYWNEQEISSWELPAIDEVEREHDQDRETELVEKNEEPQEENHSYALAIVLNEQEYQQWKKVKEKLKLSKDTTAFLKLISKQ